jgi:hypothetical protein
VAGGRAFDEPATYEVRVKGALEAAWAAYWFEGWTVAPLPGGQSALTGQVADQSALLGVLARLRDLGLPLVSVQRRTGGVSGDKESQRGPPTVGGAEGQRRKEKEGRRGAKLEGET